MNRTARVRICTATNALEEVAGTSSHQVVSSTQKEALLDLLQREMRRGGICKEEAANLTRSASDESDMAVPSSSGREYDGVTQGELKAIPNGQSLR